MPWHRLKTARANQSRKLASGQFNVQPLHNGSCILLANGTNSCTTLTTLFLASDQRWEVVAFTHSTRSRIA